MRIVVAMSGGVDSSVAAALLARQGHDVIGLSMQLYDQSRGADAVRHLLHDRRSARRAAGRGPPRHPPLHRQLRAEVQRDGGLGLRARVRGGTHADPVRALQRRPEVRDAGRPRGRLRRRAGRDRPLRAGRARRGHAGGIAPARRRSEQGPVLLPLHADAGAARARDVPGRRARQGRGARAGARRSGLAVADKPDSHEICFVPDGDHAAFLEAHGIRDSDGRDPRRRGAASSASTTASTASRSASARGSASPPRSRSTSSASTPAPNAVTVGPRERARAARR